MKGWPNYLGWMMERDEQWQAWGRLPEVIRTGEPLRQLEQEPDAADFFPGLVRSFHIMNREPAQRTAAIVRKSAGRGARNARVLDVACGSGVWSIAVAQANPHARVTAHDFPSILPITREYVEREGLADRFDYLPGDLKTADFKTKRYHHGRWTMDY